MARSKTLLAAATLILVAGCGGVTTRAVVATTPAPKPSPLRGHCIAADAPRFRLCGQPVGEPIHRRASTIQRRTPDGWAVVAEAPPRTIADGIPHGHWAGAWLAPNGKRLLAQWSAECEIPIAFFVDVETGALEPVTGEKDWTAAPESIALGWSADGRGRVRLPKGACGTGAPRPGVYLIDPATNEAEPA
jgi:hypothetical protein